MLPSPCLDVTADAYDLESSTWLALEGHIPGDPLHNPRAWAAWRLALHAALQAATGSGQRPAPLPGP
jgi:hypothetical protein